MKTPLTLWCAFEKSLGPALAILLWDMFYFNIPGVVSQLPEQLRKMMDVIEFAYAPFALTVLEAKTEIMRLRPKGMPEATASFRVEASVHMYNQRMSSYSRGER